MPIERIDQLCKEEEKVKITINTYKTNLYYGDKTGLIVNRELVQTGGYGTTIESSKDVFQFDNSDMKQLSKHVKRELR